MKYIQSIPISEYKTELTVSQDMQVLNVGAGLSGRACMWFIDNPQVPHSQKLQRRFTMCRDGFSPPDDHHYIGSAVDPLTGQGLHVFEIIKPAVSDDHGN